MKPKYHRSSPSWKVLTCGTIAGIILAAIIAASYHGAGTSGFCLSCHSMKEPGKQWQASLHKQFSCIECHLPDSHIVAQVSYKARAGLNDLYHETLRSYPATISVSQEGRMIVEDNCRRCHYSTIENTPMAKRGGNCLKCHRYLVHGQGPEKGGIKVE